MTITLHWWMLPLLIVVWAFWMAQRASEWDFTTPMVVLGLLLLALGICVGHFLF